jgi:ABC-type thiamine transport system substrate-binding protein
MRNRLFLLVVALLLVVTSCNHQPIATQKVTQLSVASDFLTEKDSILFKGFQSYKGVKVHIVPMSADSIVDLHKRQPYNLPFDVVILQSSYDMHHLSSNKVFHELPSSVYWENASFIAPNKDWEALAIDPFVIAGINSPKDVQYSELTFGNRWENAVRPINYKAFQASILFQFGKENTKKSQAFMEKLASQSSVVKDTSMIADSIRPKNWKLLQLSDALLTKQIFRYPSQSQKFGAFYDVIGIGIVSHSSIYSTAESFIQFLKNSTRNQWLCNNWKVLPVIKPSKPSPYEYQNNYPMLFRGGPKQIVSHFKAVDSIVIKMN